MSASSRSKPDVGGLGFQIDRQARNLRLQSGDTRSKDGARERRRRADPHPSFRHGLHLLRRQAKAVLPTAPSAAHKGPGAKPAASGRARRAFERTTRQSTARSSAFNRRLAVVASIPMSLARPLKEPARLAANKRRRSSQSICSIFITATLQVNPVNHGIGAA